eukprot:4080285-Amphidinium_carterae.1
MLSTSASERRSCDWAAGNPDIVPQAMMGKAEDEGAPAKHVPSMPSGSAERFDVNGNLKQNNPQELVSLMKSPKFKFY